MHVLTCEGERTQEKIMAGVFSSIFLLPDEMLLHVVEYLDIDDRITLAYTCSRFRRIYQNNRKVMRKVDLSRYLIRKTGPLKDFFRDQQLLQNIRELNLNNRRVNNWQMNDDLYDLIIACPPHLEALHLLQCRSMSLRCLNHILQHATKLTSLAFSIMNLTQEDIEFIRQNINGIWLGNIKRLHIESVLSTAHLGILKYLILSSCKYLEELEIFFWSLSQLELNQISDDLRPFCEQLPAKMEAFQNFHSLTVKTESSCSPFHFNYTDLSNFIISVAKKKSCKTKWKRLSVSPTMLISLLLDKSNADDFSAVEVFSVNSASNIDEMKVLFQTINDGVVRKLQLHHAQVLEKFLGSVSRIGGGALQSLSVFRTKEMDVDPDCVFKMLFSSCSHIRELDLIGCDFKKNICGTLSKLKHLVRILVPQCAVAPDRTKVQMNKESEKLLTLVENCPDVYEFHVHGCINNECNSHHFLVDDDLFPLAKWTKLKSLKCALLSLSCKQYSLKVSTATQHENTFLKSVVENCKFLTMLMFGIEQYDKSYFTIFESACRLKHLGIYHPDIDLGSGDFWKLIICCRNLERVCIRSDYEGRINVSGALEMLKSLPQLHVLHLHVNTSDIANLKAACSEILKAVEEEKSDRSSCFELFVQCDWASFDVCVVSHNILPLNISELCCYNRSTILPTV